MTKHFWRLATVSALAAVAMTVASAASGSPLSTCLGLAPTIAGTAGDDVINGTAGPDVIAAGNGNDQVWGHGGDDVICGGAGNDVLQGGDGDDVLDGGAGDDILDGGVGGCCGPGNGGDDALHGGPGNDELHTSDFPTDGNRLYGEQGDDRLFVWSGGWAYGGNGDDAIRQFSSDAYLDGGNGNDDIVDWDDGGFRNETVTMVGGNGDDVLRSEDLTSTAAIDGGRGFDTCAGGDSSAGCEA